VLVVAELAGDPFGVGGCRFRNGYGAGVFVAAFGLGTVEGSLTEQRMVLLEPRDSGIG
jgi:hypothetical protein